MKKDYCIGYYNELCYKSITEEFNNKIEKEVFGKKYYISDDDKEVMLATRIKIEPGIELSIMDIKDNISIEFDNSEVECDILEIGYHIKGNNKMKIKMDDDFNSKVFHIKPKDIFIYKSFNSINRFEFHYKPCIAISINVDLKLFKTNDNQNWHDYIEKDWEKNINKIFLKNPLIVEKKDIKLIKKFNDIYNLKLENILDFIKLKKIVLDLIYYYLSKKTIKNNNTYLSIDDMNIVEKAKIIIEKDIENNLNNNEIAKSLYLSVYKLQKAFKNVTGNTVYQYRKKIKINQGKKMLSETDKSIIEISNELGYSNPSKFANAFKKIEGLNPLAFRNKK